MSLLRFNSITEYWQNGLFVGNDDFKRVMSRDDFTQICSKLGFRPNENVELPEKSKNPLWHSCQMITVLQKHCANLAVPLGTAAIDENTVRTKARTKARTYMPNKPDKYGIQFYSTVGSKPGAYLHNF